MRAKPSFDVDVDVVLPQRELYVLAVGIDRDQVAARLLIGWNQGPFRRDNQFTHPVQRDVGPRSGFNHGPLSRDNELLPGGQRLLNA